ncbi:hypothetical protein P7K49_001983 [Saguinus oedipus]|uniref:Uncharacterized protein n=1 Tax=Saguinus oedipus TaxID=9490 RepID=A0ABQ9WG07_SAGOE|nr:hypothetical protein P7K49_001983 [Saguinus oedipus]
MAEESPRSCGEPVEPKATAPPERTSDYYRVSADLPGRFNNPGWFRGYRPRKTPKVLATEVKRSEWSSGPALSSPTSELRKCSLEPHTRKWAWGSGEAGPRGDEKAQLWSQLRGFVSDESPLLSTLKLRCRA